MIEGVLNGNATCSLEDTEWKLKKIRAQILDAQNTHDLVRKGHIFSSIHF